MSGESRFKKDLGELQRLLLKCCPPDENNIRSIPVLAEAMGMSAYAIYRWLERESVPPSRVKTLVELSDGDVTQDDFLKFVFKDSPPLRT